MSATPEHGGLSERVQAALDDAARLDHYGMPGMVRGLVTLQRTDAETLLAVQRIARGRTAAPDALRERVEAAIEAIPQGLHGPGVVGRQQAVDAVRRALLDDPVTAGRTT